MSRKRLGMTAIVDGDGRPLGLYTDGDLRRSLDDDAIDLRSGRIDAVMTRAPRTIDADALAVEAAQLMEAHKINALLVLDATPGRRRAEHPRPVARPGGLMTMPTYPAEVLERAAKIKLIGFDVDGTLTDARLDYGTDGSEAKGFHVQDGMGFTLLRQRRHRDRAGHRADQPGGGTARPRTGGFRTSHRRAPQAGLCAHRRRDGHRHGRGRVHGRRPAGPGDLPASAWPSPPANAHHWVRRRALGHPRNGGEGAGARRLRPVVWRTGRVEAILAPWGASLMAPR